MKAFFNKKLVRFYLYMILSIGSVSLPLIFPGGVSLLKAEDYPAGDSDCNQK